MTHMIEYAHVHELMHAVQKNLHRAIQQNAQLKSLIIRLKSAKINYKPTFPHLLPRFYYLHYAQMISTMHSIDKTTNMRSMMINPKLLMSINLIIWHKLIYIHCKINKNIAKHYGQQQLAAYFHEIAMSCLGLSWILISKPLLVLPYYMTFCIAIK